MPTESQIAMKSRGISRLLNVDKNAKTIKGQKKGYLTGILYLAPADLSGLEVCPMRSPGCTAGCLNTAGKGGMPHAQRSRINKTRWYFEERETFMSQLSAEIDGLIRKAKRDGLTPVVRLNGTSDIPWERIRVSSLDGQTIIEWHSGVQFYDYTKITKRALAHARGEMPVNYALTFSLTEENDHDALRVLHVGGQVSALFAAKKSDPLPLVAAPSTSSGRIEGHGSFTAALVENGRGAPVFDVVDGDETDLRFLDKRGVVIGLYPKGRARRDTSGFVRPIRA